MKRSEAEHYQESIIEHTEELIGDLTEENDYDLSTGEDEIHLGKRKYIIISLYITEEDE